RQDAVGRQPDLFHVARIADHRDDHVAACADVARALAPCGSLFQQCRRFFARAVVDAERMTGRENMPRHALAHVAQADEADPGLTGIGHCHASSSMVAGRASRAGPGVPFDGCRPRSNPRRYIGVNGCWLATTPKGASASFTALVSAPIEPITPPSAMPLMPAGVAWLGVCIDRISKCGSSCAVATR